MIRCLPVFLVALVVPVVLVTPARGQSPSFALSYILADGNIHGLSNGTAVAFPSVDVNSTTTGTISIINQGTGSGSVLSLAVTGAGFQLVNPTLLPASIDAGQTLRFGIIFAPTQTGTFAGTFRIDLSDRSISGTLAGSTPPPVFGVGYIDPATNNAFALPNNSTLQFPNTPTGNTSVVTVVASNTGAGTGSINSIALASGAPFQLVSLPPLPFSVGPSKQTTFGIRFSPQQPLTSTNTLRIDFGGQTITINLQAQGTQPQYTYSWASGTASGSFSSGGTLAASDTAVGQTSSLVLTVANAGTGDGQISNLSVAAQGFSVSDLPTLPFILHPGGSEHFTVNFAPAQPGPSNGRLTIGSDSFTITGTGIGPQMIFTYTSGSSAVPVANSGVVIFPPLAVGSIENLSFSIQNKGTSTATISTIGLTAPGTPFTVSKLPDLPMNVDPGATAAFTISFVPNNTGSLTATLLVNTNTFTLSGSGTQPAALPDYHFQGPSGNQQPAQQPTVGLTLASPYPLALQGTLKLTFTPAVFTDDPSIQFATGSRTVNFTIPANTTQALFNGSSTTVPLQTGTTAGNIVITPSFAMQGGFDLTPSSPDVLALTIPGAAPQLLNATVSAMTTSSFAVAINGYSTTRVIRQLDIQITPRQGQNLSTAHVTIDANPASTAWFQSTASQGFGGTFLVTIPFVLSNGSTATDLVHLLQSLSITATNDVGASSALSVVIP